VPLIEEIKGLLGFTETDRKTLQRLGAIVGPYLPELAEVFYAQILRQPAAARVLTGGQAQIDRLKITLQRWARELFSGRYDEAYARDRYQIGQRHVRLGVEQKFVISAMAVVRSYLLGLLERQIARPAARARAQQAVNKILDLDLNLMCESYFHESLRELRELNDRLEAANLELAQLSRVKDDFLAHTSHELRTPLNSILGFTKLILDGLCKTPEEERELLRDVYTSAQHLLEIVNDILDVAKIEAGKLHLQLQPVPLRRVFEQVLDVIRVQAQGKKLKLVDETAANNLPLVFADENRLRQVLINLLDNAVKFTDQGWVTLRADAERVPGHVLVEVQDTGVGIPLAKQKELFDKFKQVDTSFTRRHGGSGLGLAISRRLVEMMGGRIELESPGEGFGTTVRFTLPVYTVTHDHPHRRDQPALEIAGDRHGPRVLLMDNDAAFRNYLSRLLANHGFAVVTADSVEDALDAAERFRPMVAITDWVIPTRPASAYSDGLQFLATLAERRDWEPFYPLVITGHDLRKAEEELDRYAIQPRPRIFRKPIDAEEFLTSLRTMLAPAPNRK